MRLSRLPFSNSKPRAFCASIMVWASSAKTGTKRTAVVNAKANSYGIRDCSSARPRWSGEVVRKNTEKDSTSTMKRRVRPKADSMSKAVIVQLLVNSLVNMFMAKMKPARKAAPRRERSHCFETFAMNTKGSCIRNSIARGNI